MIFVATVILSVLSAPAYSNDSVSLVLRSYRDEYVLHEPIHLIGEFTSVRLKA
jgi:hypothetical protein